MLGQDFQLDRIFKQLLLIEDHINAVLEGSKYKTLCLDCLTEKHLPLIEGLAVECMDGVCTTGKVKELMTEVIKLMDDFREIIYNSLTREKIMDIAERIRDLRKKIHKEMQIEQVDIV